MASDRDRLLLDRRYGLSGAGPATLAAIGEELGISRERVRQLVLRLEKEIQSHDSLVRRFRLRIEEDTASIWAAWSGEFGGIVPSNVTDSALETLLSGGHRLALRVVGIPPKQFLNEIAVATAYGWFRGQASEYLIDRLVRELIVRDELTFPVSIRRLAAILDAPDSAVRIAAALCDQTKIYSEYVHKGVVSRRARRAIWLHRILASMPADVPHQTSELTDEHNRLRPHFSCSIRDAEIVLSRNRHLFLEIGRGSWAAIGGVRIAESSVDREEVEDSHPDESDEPIADLSAESAVGLLARYLDEHGPSRYVSIAEALSGSGGIKRGSIGPLLIASGEFVRFAPGVYGLHSQVDQRDARARGASRLLDDEACSSYVRAKRCGEVLGAYPLWNYSMEHAWAEWARRNASLPVYASLLSVIEPGKWPTADADEKARWCAGAERDADYQLDAELEWMPELPDVTPRDLACALWSVVARGHIGWVAVNRILKRRENSWTGTVVVAVLVESKALAAESDWRRAHLKGPDAEDLYALMSEELYANAELTWDGPFARAIADRIRRYVPRDDDGWLLQDHADRIAQAYGGLGAQASFDHEGRGSVDLAIQLGVAVALSDGEMSEAEVARIRKFADDRLASLPERARLDVESEIERSRSNAGDAAVSIARELSASMPAERKLGVFRHLFEIAMEDGVLTDGEDRILREVLRGMGVPESVFDELMDAYVEDSDHVALDLLERTVSSSSESSDVDELVSLVTLI